MKTKNTIVLIIASLLILSSVNAEYKIYDNVYDFEKDKGAVCEAATDGCNNFFMNNGKVMGGTLMACPEEQKIEWTCTRYKDNVMTTKMLPTTTNHEMVENLEVTSNLSENDQNFYNTIKNRLDIKYQNVVDKIILNFDKKLSKFSNDKQNIIKKIMIEKIENKISDMLLLYPQDIALPKKVNNRYLTYTLLKFELMK